VIGAGAYDAWGNARPNPDTSTGSGATLLAGLTGSQPFGYAGQYYDASAGTYDMRAREYSPQQGRFESEDPLLSQTGEPYDYAGDNPVYQDNLYSIFQDAEYLINIPMLKGHKRAGMTMFAKNHFGSQTRADASHLHGGLVAPAEAPKVRVGK